MFGCSDDKESTTAGTTVSKPRDYPDQGISDTEIKLGGTWPLTGPILASAAIAEAPKAYFDYINATTGGVDGRKFTYIYYDDTYNPASTVDQSRRLLTQDRVFCLAAGLGTAQQNAVMPLAEQGKVPQVYISTTSSIFLDAKKHPYTTCSVNLPPYYGYGAVYGDYINREKPNSKVAVLYQNDDLGKDYLAGIKSTLKAPAAIVSEQTYEPTDQDLSSQVLKMRDAGADVWLSASVQRPHTAALKAAGTLGWKPLMLNSHATISLAAIKSSGLSDAYKDSIALVITKDPFDPTMADDKALADAKKVVDQFAPNINRNDPSWVSGQIWAMAFIDAVKRMKDNSRQALLDAVRATKGFDANGLYIPGITASATAGSNALCTQGKLARWNGTFFEPFGQVVNTPLPPTT